MFSCQVVCIALLNKDIRTYNTGMLILIENIPHCIKILKKIEKDRS
jgi:hypothetical protein